MSRVVLCDISRCDVSLLSSSDRLYIEYLSSAKRRREVSAWRSLLRLTLREMSLPDYEILYRESGAPYMVGSDLYIGVSHSSRAVALIVSKSPCGIDVESCDRNFEGVASRFTTAEEIALFEERSRAEILPIIWCAKETLYKIAGCEGVDLIRDLELLAVDGDKLQARALTQKHHLRFEIRDGECLVYSC
ncbi:MAG: 4'-phosphopantetheinyl transferase superfamily protein [Rikenellaceae bacterium]